MVGLTYVAETEYVAACELPDNEYPSLLANSYNNTYNLGRIADHNFVIAFFPKGRYGITSTTNVANVVELYGALWHRQRA